MNLISKPKIRIGILADDLEVPLWFYAMIERIIRDNYSEIVLIVKKSPPAKKELSFFQKLRTDRTHLAYKLYRRLEDSIFKPTPFAFTSKKLRELLPDTPLIEVTPHEKISADIFLPADIDLLKPYNIDVFIRIGFRILRGDILTVAKLGIWSYHHGDNQVNRGGPAGVWETIDGWREMGSVLQILTEHLDDGKILSRSWSQKNTILINRSLQNIYWKSISFIPRKLAELYRIGADEFIKKVEIENDELTFYSKRFYTTPRNSEFISKICRQYLQWIKRKIVSMFYLEQWILMYCFSKEEKLSTSMFRFKRITPPKDRFWADPCIIYKDDTYFIFTEELIYDKNKGKAHIIMIEMDNEGNCKEPVVVLKKDYHLSYPFVFQYNNEYYMVPETTDNATIELFKCTSFPHQWEFLMNLKEEVLAVDTTIFLKDNKVWMFTNIKENPGASVNDELFLFYTDDLFSGDWKPHLKNPVISDIKSARPAGALFYHGNKLFRPSQDGSFKYGHGTVINEVVELSEVEYIERKVGCISPDWSRDIVGTHTLTRQHKLTVVDALVKRSRWGSR